MDRYPIPENLNDEGCFLTEEEPMNWKSMLQDYAREMKLEMPAFNTSCTSSLVLNGVTYVGRAAETRQKAEQLAAFAAFQSLYDDTKSRMKTMEEIKSKYRAALLQTPKVEAEASPSTNIVQQPTAAMNAGKKRREN